MNDVFKDCAIEEQLWKGIRIMKTFNVINLQVVARGNKDLLEENIVKKYLNILEKAEYIKALGNDWYELIMYATGPSAPIEYNKVGIYDPNMKEVILFKKFNNKHDKQQIITYKHNNKNLLTKSKGVKNANRTSFKVQ